MSFRKEKGGGVKSHRTNVKIEKLGPIKRWKMMTTVRLKRQVQSTYLKV